MNDISEVKSIIEESGNSFHCSVLNEFRSRGWDAIVSPYYLDEISNKPREIDLVAEKSFKYVNHVFDKYGTVNAQLFIECKYIKQKVVFWFDNKNINSTKKWILSNTPLEENSTFFKQHSYLSKNKKVAKLFSSESRSNQENDPIYKALNQSLHSMVYLRSRGSIIQIKANRLNSILVSFCYPVIICNSFENFYSVDILNQDNPIKITDNFQLEVNYAYVDKNKNTKNEYFLIDVININNLNNYLEIIETDVNTIKNML